MDAKKMGVAVLVSLVAAAAALAATAHSRRVLEQEQAIYPPGTLALGEEATTDGVQVRLEEADVAEIVASLETRGYERMSAAPDRRFLRLTLSITNASDKPVSTEALCKTIQVIATGTGQPVETELVWLRGWDALPKTDLPPGESTTGKKIALHISEFVLAFPFVVKMGEDSALWGVDVIDRDAPVEEFM